MKKLPMAALSLALWLGLVPLGFGIAEESRPQAQKNQTPQVSNGSPSREVRRDGKDSSLPRGSKTKADRDMKRKSSSGFRVKAELKRGVSGQ